jgi:transposase-like protein
MSKKQSALTLAVIAQRFSDEDKARDYFERLRWPEGPACPHCGSAEVYRLTAKAESVKPGRKGLLKCKYCRKQFTVTVGTIFEASHIPLNKWLMAIYLLCTSKKGMSAHQMHRMLRITYKSAWFMCHRIRYAMEQGPNSALLSGIVEADETYVGGKRRQGEWKASGFKGGPAGHMAPVVALVERGGRVRAFPMERVTAENLHAALKENVAPSARIMTDEHPSYLGLDKHFASHETVNHSKKEYVRGDVSTNTIEGFFGLLKRGVNGIYHHVSKKHLHRYVGEFEFRYNGRKMNDGDRTMLAIAGFEGKRLKYRD